jgi:hypothetical protein
MTLEQFYAYEDYLKSPEIKEVYLIKKFVE